MIKIARLIFPCFLALVASPTCAQWYVGQAQQTLGNSQVSESEMDKIRAVTIKQAIENASLQASSHITIESTVENGLLQKNTSTLYSEHEITSVELLHESITNNILSITLKANIVAASQCDTDDYLKSITLSQFPLLTSAQAAPGSVFQLPYHVSTRMKYSLQNQPNLFVNKLIGQSFIHPSEQIEFELDTDKLAALFENLTVEQQSQYIVFGYIRDISLYEETKSGIISKEQRNMRNFTVKVYLYEPITNSILLEQEYHGEGEWSFPVREKVDLSNSLFWKSDYGNTVLETLYSAAIDINDQLKCETTKASISYLDKDIMAIKMGTEQGIKLGDDFTLRKLKRLRLNNQTLISLIEPEKTVQLEVIQANRQSSLIGVIKGTDKTGQQQDQIELSDILIPEPKHY